MLSNKWYDYGSVRILRHSFFEIISKILNRVAFKFALAIDHNILAATEVFIYCRPPQFCMAEGFINLDLIYAYIIRSFCISCGSSDHCFAFNREICLSKTCALRPQETLETFSYSYALCDFQNVVTCIYKSQSSFHWGVARKLNIFICII